MTIWRRPERTVHDSRGGRGRPSTMEYTDDAFAGVGTLPREPVTPPLKQRRTRTPPTTSFLLLNASTSSRRRKNRGRRVVVAAAEIHQIWWTTAELIEAEARRSALPACLPPWKQTEVELLLDKVSDREQPCRASKERRRHVAIRHLGPNKLKP